MKISLKIPPFTKLLHEIIETDELKECVYFNKIDGHYVDLTREQFDLYDIPVKYEPNEKMNREYCGKNPDTKARYHQLQRNMIKFLRDKNSGDIAGL